MKKSKKIERLSPPRANIKDGVYEIELEWLSKARNKTEEKILTMIIDEFKRADIVLPIERCYFLKDAIGDKLNGSICSFLIAQGTKGSSMRYYSFVVNRDAV